MSLILLCTIQTFMNRYLSCFYLFMIAHDPVIDPAKDLCRLMGRFL